MGPSACYEARGKTLVHLARCGTRAGKAIDWGKLQGKGADWGICPFARELRRLEALPSPLEWVPSSDLDS